MLHNVSGVVGEGTAGRCQRGHRLSLQEWNHHFFMLTSTGLYFTDQTDIKKDDDDDDNLSVSGLDLNGSLEVLYVLK